MEDCRYDVDYFMKLFGQDNFDLLTEQSNTYRAAECISRNKNIPAFSEKEIRQVVGTLLYNVHECCEPAQQEDVLEEVSPQQHGG